MPSPSSALVTLRPDLAGSFQQFDTAADRQGFIGLRVAPVMDVAQASGYFSKLTVDQLLANRDTKRAPGSGYARGKFTFSTDTYVTQEYGAEETVDDNESQLYRNFFDAEQIAAQRAYDAVLRAQETRIEAMVRAGVTATSGVAVTWKTYASSTPIVDIELATQTVYANSGVWPNTLILTRTQFRNLRESAQIVDRIKYSGIHNPTAGGITTQVLAQVFDLPNVIIAGSTANSAHEGQTASLGSLWTNDAAYVAYIDTSNDIRRPTLCRTFHWSADGSSIGGTVEQYREESIRGDVYRVRHQVGEKLLYASLGYKLTGCNT